MLKSFLIHILQSKEVNEEEEIKGILAKRANHNTLIFFKTLQLRKLKKWTIFSSFNLDLFPPLPSEQSNRSR